MLSSHPAREAERQPFAVATGRAVDRRLWWQLCERDPDATFFACPEWSDILVESFSAFHARPYLFAFAGGANVVVPAVEVRRARGHLSALHSMPFGTYGGLVGDAALTHDAAPHMLRHLVTDGWSRYHTTVFQNPLGSALPESLARNVDHVYAPDLSRGYDAWWTGLDERTRYHIKKSARRGVSVDRSFTEPAFDSFARLYERSARAWNPPAHFGPRFFRAAWERRSSRIQLWTARFEGRVVAGVLAFQWGRQVTPFLSAIAPDARRLAPTNLIYDRIIAASAAEDATSLSFLGSGQKRSVERFKASMGGTKRSFRHVNVEGPAYRFVRNPLLGRVRRMGARIADTARNAGGVIPKPSSPAAEPVRRIP